MTPDLASAASYDIAGVAPDLAQRAEDAAAVASSNDMAAQDMTGAAQSNVTGSCDLPNEGTCIDYVGYTAAQAMGSCNSTYSTSPCSRVDLVGGCTFTGGGVSETKWYYVDSGATSAGLMQSCPNGGGTYTAP